MKSNKMSLLKSTLINILILGLLTSGCSHNNGSSSQTCPSGSNVMQVTVDGSLCGSSVYVNEPCTSVTICAVSTQNCQILTNILLDTGSYGLRIFSSAISAGVLSALNPVTTVSPAGSAAECAVFGTGKTWGGIRSADVILGGESPVTAPIQIIDHTYSGGDSQTVNGNATSVCGSSDVSPSTTGYNGILGVGLFVQDCGTSCSGIHPLQEYYACNGTTCSGNSAVYGAQISLANQVTNPAALLSKDNTGIILSLPNVSSTGNSSVIGCAILGIGTESNNSPGGVAVYGTNGSGDFTTTLGGSNYSSFLDSGSNGLFVPKAAVGTPPISGSWFVPNNTEDFTAVNTGYGGTPANSFTLEIANANVLFETGNSVFYNLSGPYSTEIDLGLPYFYGRNVYVGFEGMTTSLGTGPYWAY
jgi:hypothetical protein